MDRFIDYRIYIMLLGVLYLKSNMDRFIVTKASLSIRFCFYLKSNMDRFIELVNKKQHKYKLI